MVSSGAVALFLQGLVLGFTAAAQPGPFQAYLLSQSLRNGAGRTLPVVLVPLVSDPLIIALVLAVLTHVPGGLVRALQVGGGGLLLWLALGALRQARAPAAEGLSSAGAPRGFWRAVLVNLTNPNAWMFWSLVGGPILASAWRGGPAHALAFLGGFYPLLVGGNAVLVLLAGSAVRLGPRFSRSLAVASGLALLAIGAWQIGRGLTGA